MPKVNYSAKLFPSNFPVQLQGTNTINTNWANILHSAYTVGKKSNRFVYSHGVYSLFEILYRSLIISSNLKENNIGELIKTNAYKDLDASEKSAVSFFMGLTSAKLLSENLLGIKWLLHYDRHYRSLNILNSSVKSRPDLVGKLPARAFSGYSWAVIEAKGRTGNKTKKLISDAKAQTRLVLAIQNTTNLLRIASASYFKKDHFNIYWEDPEGENDARDDLIDITINNHEIMEGSYGLIQSMIISSKEDKVEKINNNEFQVTDIPVLDVRIGIKKEIYEMLKLKQYNRIIEVENIIADNDLITSEENLYIGRDGVLVKCGEAWNKEEMRKEPNERV